MKIDFSYYLSIFWRRFPYFAVLVALFTGLGLTVATVLPPEYEATATMLVESPEIPDKLASSTVATVASEQLQVLQQRLMTRSNLIDTAARLNVFPDADTMTASQVVDSMRSRTSFRTETGRNEATFFRVTFRGDTPQMTARVVNEYVTLVLDENVRLRTGRAGGTLEFFQDEVDRLSTQLDAQSSQILEFKTENANALPENRDFLMSRRVALVEEERILEARINDLNAQKVKAQELFDSTGSVSSQGQSNPLQLALLTAEQELENALTVYNASNPKVRLLQAKVDSLRRRITGAEASDSESTASDSAARAVLEAQLADLDRRIADAEARKTQISEELAQVEGFLAEVPANTVLLDSLQRDFDQTRKQYAEATSGLSAAATGERIELLSKGQRITVIEQATPPEKPTSPNRLMIAVGGLGAGVSMGLGLILLLEILNRSIRRPIEITDKLGIAPFAVLPLIRTDREVQWRRTTLLLLFFVLLIGVPLAIYLVHTQLVPLDSFAERFLRKFGLTLTL